MALTAGSIEIKLFADLARLQADMNKANKTVDAAMRNIDKSVGLAKRAFNGLAVSFSALQVVKLADDYKRFDSQLQLSTKNLETYTTAYENVIRISKAAQSEIGAVGVLYSRLNNNLRDFNVTQKQVSDTTETIALSLRASNATVQETSSVMLQLSQSFGSGRLNGQEFLAVAEGAPVLLRQLAKSMGVPFGALKDLSAQGKITREELLKAFTDPKFLESQRQAASQVGTISSAITVLTNNLKLFVGEADKATGSSNAIRQVIQLVAENINILAGVALVGVIAKIGQFTAGIAASAVAMRARQLELVKEQVLLERKIAMEAAAAAATANNARAVTMAAHASSAAMTEQAAVASAVAAKMTLTARATSALGLAVTALGGPIGAVTTLLGLGAVAWMAWGDAGKISADKIAGAVDRVNQGLASINDAKLIQMQKNMLEAEKAASIEQQRRRQATGALAALSPEQQAKQQALYNAQLEEYDRQIRSLNDALAKHNTVQKENTVVVTEADKIYAEMAKSGKILSVEIAEQNQLIKNGKMLLDAHKITQSDYNRIVEDAQKKIATLTGETKRLKEEEKERAKIHKDLIKQAIELAKQEQQAYDEFTKAQKKSRQEAIGNNDELQKEIDKRNEAIEILLNGEDGYAMLQIARMEETIATVEQTIAQAELNSTTADGIKYANDYLEKLKEELRLRKELREKAAIERNLEKDKKDKLDKEREAIRDVESDFKKLERAIDRMAKNSAQSMAQFIMGTKTSFSDMINSMIEDIIQLLLYKNITQPIAEGISGSIGTGAFKEFFSGMFGGAFANGGMPPVGKASLVGERGPELFVPKTAGTVIPNHELGMGDTNNVNVVVNVTQDGSDVRSSSEFGKNLGNAIKNAVQAEIINQKRQGGLLA